MVSPPEAASPLPDFTQHNIQRSTKDGSNWSFCHLRRFQLLKAKAKVSPHVHDPRYDHQSITNDDHGYN
jgi:hypothetical protein